MKKVLIFSPAQPSRTPRLVRNASAFKARGFEVHVVCAVISPELLESDLDLARENGWEFHPVAIFANGRLDPRIRLVRKVSLFLASLVGGDMFSKHALFYGAADAYKTARNIEADYVFAQQQAAIPLACAIARERGIEFGCDIEDILGESAAEPRKLIGSIERRYLPLANCVATMSHVAGDYLMQKYALTAPCVVLHNCHLRAEVSALLEKRVERLPRSIYWFGQTLGSHSLAVELIQANASLGHPFRIFLRGRMTSQYSGLLQDSILRCGASDVVTVLDICPADEMLAEAAKFSVLLGSQPTRQLFHQLAIGNKVFTGMGGGCRLLLSETIAHVDLVKRYGVQATFFSGEVQGSLERALVALLEQEAGGSMQAGLHNRALDVLNWEVESSRLIEAASHLN